MGESAQPIEVDVAGEQRAALARVAAVVGETPGDVLEAAIRALTDAGFAVEFHEVLSPADAITYDLVLHDPDPSPGPNLDGDVNIGRLHIDVTRKLAYVDGVPIRMSAREFVLLHYLASHPNIVFSRDALLRAVWGSTWRTEGSVTEYIRRLRVLLEPTGIGECLVTRKGFGYSFDPDAVR